MGKRIDTVEREGLTFDVRDEGPIDGEPVVLLHGFPQDARSWDAVAARLHEAGYRTIAPDQRGYSPRARPGRRRDYRIPALVDDIVALVGAIGGGPVHLVGHDWGAVVAWVVAARRPDLVRTLTAVSVPHPAAFMRAMVTSPQLLKSWYILAFQLPWIPEMLLSNDAVTRFVLRRSGQPPETAERDAARMADASAVRGGVNWYRALFFADPRETVGRVRVPTLMVWSDGDIALTRAGADGTGKYVSAPYRLEVLEGVSHWIPDEVPDELGRLIVEHAGVHS
ncbi:alpha/beta fold hydrolase [Rhodococcus chondri]|uniref:Alpha/beta fold hydrolase n=1 Tax=Rhodococcus chondri TaxID=3065941 RepID=A0ABU7JLS0_9NOCA|nr:alpha/beta fold hydrolase [Rhodococcus sp. CC-R104]MEE2030804.1 alpha/beta fold hydrolase [Rhodococcus sp. CC-R104]